LTGMIFDLKRFAVHDGPGIRTTVFLKGCSLHCAWCHSPESQNPHPEVLFLATRCQGCGACAAACPRGLLDSGPAMLDRRLCDACGLCAEVCYAGALTIAGHLIDLADLVELLLRDRVLYAASGGGVTVSGGEPALQPAFVADLLETLHGDGVHTAVETAGNVEWDDLWRACAAADLVLYDFKHHSASAHRRWTGAGNEQVLANLVRLSERFASSGQALVVRIPLIPGVNDSQQDLSTMAAWLAKLPALAWVELLPYHNLGLPKYGAIGRSCDAAQLTPVTEGALRAARDWLAGVGAPVILEGEVSHEPQ